MEEIQILLFGIVLASSIIFLSVSGQEMRKSPVITTKTGPLRGHLVKLSSTLQVYEFTAIPFAEPPIGERRFKKPTPKTPWIDELDATRRPNICPQISKAGMLNNFKGIRRISAKGTQAEDCLYLNIWVPRSAIGSLSQPEGHEFKKLAVLTFIHGGSFSSGGSTVNVLNGTVLAAYNNLIVVTIQYRLGSLGFAYYGTEDVPGNMGLWDQLEALRWINENIDAFGGDSNEVTIAGASAGAASVTFHLLSPHSRPYFKRAIIESGTALSPWAVRTPDVAKKLTDMVYESLATKYCNESGNLNPRASLSEKIACLKSVNAAFLPMGDLAPIMAGYNSPFVPVIDGDFLPKHPKEMLESGEFSKVPLLIGTNKDEGSMFLISTRPAMELLSMPNSPENPLTGQLNLTHYNTLIEACTKMVLMDPEPLHPLLVNAIELQYWSTSKMQTFSGSGFPNGYLAVSAAMAALGDATITCPVYTWAQMTSTFSNMGNQIFAYLFTQRRSGHVWPAWMGVLHGDESGFVFGEPFAPYGKNYGYSDDEKKFSQILMAYWSNFAKYGDPNMINDQNTYNMGHGKLKLRQWPAYSAPDANCSQSIFELNTVVQIHSYGKGSLCASKNRECTFWGHFVPKLAAALKTHSDQCEDGHCYSKAANGN